MRLSYTGLRTMYQDETGVTLTADLNVGTRRMNQSLGQILRAKPWVFLEKTATGSTVASTQYYNLPFNYGKYMGVTISVGNYKYTPKEIKTREEWDRLNMTTYTSNIPIWYFIFNDQVGIWPTPSSANQLTHIYRETFKDLSVADYTTGGVAATNADTTIRGTATVWTSQMAGRWLQIADGDTAPVGDGEWYEISSVTSGTTIVFVKNYNGSTISSGTAVYTIGQMSPLPDGYHELPVYKACYRYFASIDEKRAAYYKEMYNELLGQLVSDYGSKSDDVSLEGLDDAGELPNPNLYLSL